MIGSQKEQAGQGGQEADEDIGILPFFPPLVQEDDDKEGGQDKFQALCFKGVDTSDQTAQG